MSTLDVIASLDAPTSGAFDLTGLSLSSYKVIQIYGIGITVTTDGTDLKLRFYVGGVEQTSGYQWAMFQTSSGGTNTDDKASSQDAIWLCSDNSGVDVGNAAGKSAGFVCTVDYPGDTALYKKVTFAHTAIAPGNSAIISPGAGLLANAGAIDGIKIFGSSNLLSGYLRLLALT